MRLLVDEDLPHRLAEDLMGAGHDAVHVAMSPIRGCGDAVVFEKAHNEGRFLLTQDRGLGATWRYRPKRPSGTVVFRFPPATHADRKRETILGYFSGVSAGLLEGSVVIVEAGGRVRRTQTD